MPKSQIISSENIDIQKEIQKRVMRDKLKSPVAHFPGYERERVNDDVKSFFFNPLQLERNYYSVNSVNVETISPYYGRMIAPRVLRRVAEKGWIINLCIIHSISQARPYFKESTGENQRGFRIKHKDSIKAKREMKSGEKKEAERLVDFLLKTGDIEDSTRTDDLDKYATKLIRDLYQLDQISTELQRTKGGELCAFWAIDTATIEVALPKSERETGVKYAQVINNIPVAYYTKDDLIFDCMNPRTDIEKAGYGYSIVEQAIDLVTSSINTFIYNAGFFTENKLPKGMLLLNAPADEEEIEDIVEYTSNLLSGTPASQWKIPIVPTGRTKNSDGGGKVFEWVKFQESNRDMEFQSWFDLQLSGVAAMFRKSLEELGIHSSKSQPIIGSNNEPRMEASKSLGLGDLLTFMQKHFDQIIQIKNPDFSFEIVGYEKDDPKIVVDIDSKEIGSYKTLNEKRVEKGLEPIDISKTENPADLPMSPQVVQVWSQAKMAAGMGGGMSDDGTDYSDDDGSGEEGGEEAPDNEDGGGDDEGNPEAEEAWGNLENDHLQKSLSALRNKREVVRITI